MTSGVTPGGVVYRSSAMQKVLDVAQRLLESRTPVLLLGESGTGKDLLARHLHEASTRREGPFVQVHCPSVPAELLESELFGHERGAFTDARRTKLGKLELAEAGTLYFDQVQELSLTLQAKLLRVVEEKCFERLGSTRTQQVDVRFVFSSNVDLREAVRRGAFRDDLYHRLSVVELELPPLRERPEDVLLLAEHFLRRERQRGTTGAQCFDDEAARRLVGYAWPGNVRELRATVERAALMTTGAAVTAAELPPQILAAVAALFGDRARPASLKEIEAAYIRQVLREADGQQTRAARVLGISRKALWEKRRRYGIP